MSDLTSKVYVPNLYLSLSSWPRLSHGQMHPFPHLLMWSNLVPDSILLIPAWGNFHQGTNQITSLCMKQSIALHCPSNTIYSNPEGPGEPAPGPLSLLFFLPAADLPLAGSLSPDITSSERLSLVTPSNPQPSHHCLPHFLFVFHRLILTEVVVLSYCLLSPYVVKL